MSPGRRRRGSDLPYELLAGVVPCRGGWLVAGGKLVGTGLFPEPPFVAQRLIDIVDAVPAYAIIALASPIGLPDTPTPRGRRAEQEARKLLGWPRLGAILSAPALPVAERARSYEQAVAMNGGRLSPVTWGQINRIREVREVVQSHLQRSVYEVHAELSFYQLNGDLPLAHGKRTEEGRKERRELLVSRIQNLGPAHLGNPPTGSTAVSLLDALAALATARRIAAKAVARLPENPEWNSEGLRMEMLR